VEAAKRVVDLAIDALRDPDAKKAVGKDALKERVADAKGHLTLAQRELAALEARVKLAAAEKAKAWEARAHEDEAHVRVEDEALCGLPVEPCFDPDPPLERQGGVTKKLSDEDEKRLRASEMEESVRKKKETSPQAAPALTAGAVGGAGGGGAAAHGGGGVASPSGRPLDTVRSKLDFLSGFEGGAYLGTRSRSSSSSSASGAHASSAADSDAQPPVGLGPKRGSRASELSPLFEPASLRPNEGGSMAPVDAGGSDASVHADRPRLSDFMESAANTSEQEKM
jgi:hypothetical protein